MNPASVILSHRQRIVLKHVINGSTNKEIAASLGATEPAVKAVIQEIFRKTGVRSRAKLMKLVAERPELLQSSND